jgi:hypothetical protein
VCLISLPTFAASAAVAIIPKAKEIFRMAGKVFYIVQEYFSNQISHVFKTYHHMVSAPHSQSSSKFGAVNQGASVPCRTLRHVKEPKSDVEVATFGKISRPFLAHSSTFRC